MRLLVDSNIFVFFANPSALLYQETVDAVSRLRRRGDTPCVVPQNFYEFWVVATRPLNVRGLGLTTAQAQVELTRLKSFFQFLPDEPAISPAWEDLLIRHSVSGKPAHDARLAAAMIVHGVSNLLTFNAPDFKRFTGITAIEPKDVQ